MRTSRRRGTRTVLGSLLAPLVGSTVLAGLVSGCAVGHRDPMAQSLTVAPTTLSPEPAAGPPASAGSASAESTPAASEGRPYDDGSVSDLARAAESAAARPGPSTEHSRSADRIGGQIGADASWPQCPAGMGIEKKRSHGAPMPLGDSAYVVLGLTNGPGFTPNPCLAEQVGWVRERTMWLGAYAVVSQPDATQLARYGGTGPYPTNNRLDRLRNVGHAQATFNLASMDRAGMRTADAPVPGVWLDVEPVPNFDWGTDLTANAAVVEGAARGYRDAGLTVGVYSTPALWRRVVGDLALGLPEWRAAGQTSQAEALRRCAADWVIQGGEAVLGQWVEHGGDPDAEPDTSGFGFTHHAGWRDRNVVCPGGEQAWKRFFS